MACTIQEALCCSPLTSLKCSTRNPTEVRATDPKKSACFPVIDFIVCNQADAPLKVIDRGSGFSSRFVIGLPITLLEGVWESNYSILGNVTERSYCY